MNAYLYQFLKLNQSLFKALGNKIHPRKSVPRLPRPLLLVACIVIIVLIPTIVFLLRNAKSTKAGWWNETWLYRRAVPLTNSSGSNLSNFQVKLSLDTAALITAGKLQSTCGDLRFTNTTGTELPYWIETSANGCNTSSTSVWVKIDAIPTSGTTIYLYYGNFSAENGQNGNETFEFFDDFNDNSIDSGKWVMATYGSGGSYAETNGQLQLTASNSLTGSATAKSTFAFSHGYVMEWRRYDTEQHYNDVSFGYGNIQGDTGTSWWHTNFQYGYTNYGQDDTNFTYRRFDSTTATSLLVNIDGPNAGQWLNYKSSYDSTGNWKWSYSTGSGWTLLGAGATDTTYLNNAKTILLSRGGYSGNTWGGTSQFDYFFVRKFVATDPTMGTLGAEEKGTAPTAYWSFDERTGTTIHNQMEHNGENGLILWYKFDGANSGTSPVPNDETNNTTASFSNGAAYTSLAKQGYSTYFDGTDDYIQINNTSTLNVSNYTIDAWVNIANLSNSTQHFIVSRYSWSANQGYGLLVVNDGAIGCDFNGSVGRLTSAGSQVSAGTWYHLACVYNGSTLSIYKNGNLVTSAARSGFANYDANLYIGTPANNVGNDLYTANAYIDYVKLYNRALSATEVTADYNSLHGHAINGPTWTEGVKTSSVSEPLGSAMAFDGVNDYATVPHSTTISPTNQFAVSGWFKPSETFDKTADSNQGILDKGDYQFYLDKSDGKAKFVINDNATDAITSLGNGASGAIESLFVWKDEVYAGGNFSNIPGCSGEIGMAKWDGTSWSSVGGDCNYNGASGFTTYNGKLVVYGMLYDVGGNPNADNIAAWDGTSWSNFGTTTLNGQITTALVWNGELYIGGLFTNVGGDANADYLVKWNGSTWVSLGSIPLTSRPAALYGWNNELYVGGYFTNVGGDANADYLVKWNGSTWTTLGSVPPNDTVYSITSWKDQLIIGGGFTDMTGNTNADYVAAWNGTTWTNLGTPVTTRASSTITWNGLLAVGGGGYTGGTGSSTTNLSVWNGTSWSTPITSAMNDCINVILNWNGNLILGGYFTNLGSATGDNIVQFGTTNTHQVSSTTTVWDSSLWHHYAVTYDGTNVKMYINGKLESSVSSSMTVANQNLPLLFGTSYGPKYGNTSSENFHGQLDEIRLYNYPLTQTQVQQDVNRKKGIVLGANKKSSDPGSAGLIAWWKMDEGSGATVVDSSGNNHTGTATGTSFTTGKTGTARTFNGTSDYITASLPDQFSDYTESVWIKVPSPPTSDLYTVIEHVNTADTTNMSVNKVMHVNTSGQIVMDDYLPSSGSTVGTVNVADNRWHHIATMRQGNTRSIYIDGTLDVTAANAEVYAGQTPSVIDIGVDKRNSQQFRYFPGSIDNVKIFNRALSVAEIASEYSQGGPLVHYSFDEGTGTTIHNQMEQNGENGLVSWWKFDEGTGATVNDEMKANPGTASNYTWTTGRSGNAMSFNGSSTYVDMGAPASLMNITGPITIEAWVKRGAAATMGHIAGTYGSSDLGYNLTFGVGNTDNDKICFTLQNVTNHCTANAYADTTSWHHIVATYDRTQVKLYYDGKLTDTFAQTAALTIANGTFRIGRRAGAGYAPFSGLIDSVKVYNRALSAGEVAADYRSLQGHVINGITWTDGAQKTSAEKPMGKSATFNGSTQFVHTPIHPSHNLSSAFTISAWVKPAAGIADHGGLIGTYSGNYLGYYLSLPTDLHPGIRIGGGDPAVGGAGIQMIYSPTGIPTNTWSYLTATFDGSTAKIYVNGVLMNSGSAIGAPYSNQTLTIGKENHSTSYYNGSLDEVKIYGYALSAADIQTEYNRGAGTVLGIGKNESDAGSNGLVGWWKMDEGSNISVQDSSGYNNSGVVYNGSWASGKYGKGLSHNASNTYVEIPDSNSLDLTTAGTIEVWAKKNSQKQYQMYVTKGHTQAFQLMDYDTSGRISLRWGNDSNDLVTDEVVPIGSWNHIVGVYDGSNLSIYINGVLSKKVAWTTNGVANTTPLRIGARDDGYYFDGTLDNVKIYNRALSPAEIAYDYNQGQPLAHWSLDESQGSVANNDIETNGKNGLIAWYPLDETSGTTINDEAGVNGGTATGTTIVGSLKGKGRSFNGTNSDYITLSNNKILDSKDNFTYAFWANPTATRTTTTEANTGVSGTSGQRYTIYPDGDYSPCENNVDVGAGVSVGTNGVSVFEHVCNYLPSPLVYDTTISGWTHVAVVYRNKTPYLYLNGVLVRTGLTSTKNVHPSVTKLSTNGSYGSYAGALDNVKIYNRALTAAEIATEYNSVQGTLVGINPGTGHVVGKVGRALTFDGATTYIGAGYNKAFDFDGTKPFSVSAWVKPAVEGQSGTIISKFNTGVSGQWLLSIRNGYANIHREISPWNVAGTTYLQADTWYHIVGVYDGTNVYVYLNGKLDMTPTAMGSIGSESSPLAIGASLNSYNPVNVFNGQIDEIKVYNYALTQKQVLTDLNNGAAVRW